MKTNTTIHKRHESEVSAAMKKGLRTKLINRNCFMQWPLLIAVLLLCMAGTLLPASTEAAVSRIGNWTEVINNDTTTPFTSTAQTPGTGNTRRALVAVVGLDYTTLPTSPVTATASFGGQSMTQAAWVCGGTTSYGRCSGIFYLLESGIQAQSGGVLTFVPSSTAGTPNVVAYLATFANVDQDDPIADFSTNQSGATAVATLAFGKNVAIGAGDLGIYHLDLNNITAAVSNYGVNWATAGVSDTTTGHSSFVAQRSVPTSATSENISPAFTSNTASIAVAILNDAFKTEIGEGATAAESSTIGTSSAVTNLGAFSLGVKNGAGTDDDTITGMTVTLSGNSAQVQALTVWDNPPTTQLATIPFVSGETWTATGLTLAAADPPASQYMLRITSKASVPSGTYPVSGSVTAVTTTKGFDKIFGDAGEAVVTIDARTPTYPAGTMTVTGSTASSISVAFPYGGDNDNDNSCAIRYGTVSGTYPNVLTATRVGKTWTATASTLNPGSVYFFQATFSDPDTVSPATAVTSFGYTTDSPLAHSSVNLGATKWAANGGWGVGNGKYGRITCATCHVSNPANGNVKRIKTVIATPDSTTWGSSGSINTPASGSIVASNPATDYGTNNTTHTTSTEVCEVCHSQTSVHKYNMSPAANHYTDDCALCHKHDTAFGKPTDCALCHAAGTGLGGAPIVFDPAGGTVNGGSEAYGAHLKALKSETISGATDWETQCQKCHPLHSGGSVTIPNNNAVGINYTKTGGIHLGGSATTMTTEAQICWECHIKAANNVSEWGVNSDTNGAASNYDFGTLSQSNWIGATWTSANFSYKNGSILSTHTANPSALGGPASTNNHGQANPDTVAQIRCTYCHDVHNTATALTADVDNKPYLRGSWKGSPYREDGAPRDTHDYSSYTSGYGAVPRGGTGYTALGGFQIDQNNGNPTTGWVAGGATGFAGLCELCHNSGTSDGSYAATEINALNQFGTASTDWMGTNGHANSVLGGNGTGAVNVFSNTDRSAAAPTFGTSDGVSAGNPAMAMQQNTAAYGFSFRPPSSRASEGWNLTPRVGTEEPHTGGSYTWGVTVTAANPTQIGYHKFTCSKCHNPHASRLPRLMITNCLDTDHNTWDTKSGVNLIPSSATQSGNGATPSVSNASMPLSQATSAQNCHRVRDASYANSKGAGWNKVTPWVEFP